VNSSAQRRLGGRTLGRKGAEKVFWKARCPLPRRCKAPASRKPRRSIKEERWLTSRVTRPMHMGRMDIGRVRLIHVAHRSSGGRPMIVGYGFYAMIRVASRKYHSIISNLVKSQLKQCDVTLTPHDHAPQSHARLTLPLAMRRSPPSTSPVRLLAAAPRHLLRQSPARPFIGACEDCSCL
jgi:hypothetical protein